MLDRRSDRRMGTGTAVIIGLLGLWSVVGASFVVDKNTGLIVGGLGDNTTFQFRKVIFTPPDNLFYVVSESHGPNRHLDFLSVRDWTKRSEKPFLLVSSGMVASGICR